MEKGAVDVTVDSCTRGLRIENQGSADEERQSLGSGAGKSSLFDVQQMCHHWSNLVQR